MSRPHLLTVSGVIPEDLATRIATGARPRADYVELAEGLDADLLDYAQARRESGLVGRLLERIGGADLVLAWAALRRSGRYAAIITDGEQIGLPLATLLQLVPRRPRHLMIVHIISVRKKMLFLDLFGAQRAIDRFLVYASRQQDFIRQRWGLSATRVRFTPFMVDDRFFQPPAEKPKLARPLICAVGLERRDYPTLLRAVDGLEADVVIAAASPWSKRSDSTAGQAIPANVRVQKFSQAELRDLYAQSSMLVMPLEEVEFQAGVTAILEAMAMGLPVICSQISGQTDIIKDGENGLYVPPGDSGALRAAIERLLDKPSFGERLGAAGQRLVRDEMNLDHYRERLKRLLDEALREAPTR